VEKLFSYGTLRDAAVQRAVFGRTLEGTDDTLGGYRLAQVRLADWNGARISGDLQRTLVPADGECVTGAVLHVSDDELRLADSYEPREYQRIKVRLRSGTEAWVYLRT
jgi:gamma-glutamylcyclotransferase (GGCT)/AIG2-like uncharacterized protein YtfP